MANTQIVGAPKSYDLSKLNAWIKEKERLLGPLIEIGDGGAVTAARFDLDKPRLKTGFAFVSLKVGGACVSPGGVTSAGQGDAYITGVLKPVCLWR
jgi:hypothetical protein